MSQSIFAIVLQRLLDETEYFSREEWGDFCGVEESVIDSWLSDEALPRSDHLWMIVECLRTSDNIPPGPLEAFMKLLDKPFRDSSPIAEHTPLLGSNVQVAPERTPRSIDSMTLRQYIEWSGFKESDPSALLPLEQ